MSKVIGLVKYSSKKEMKQIIDSLKKEFSSKVKVSINKQEKYIDYLTFVDKPFAMT